MNETRYFIPKRTNTLNKRCLPWIGKAVTVRAWYPNTTMRITHPEDDCMGFVVEFAADVPESELSMSPPTEPITVDAQNYEMCRYLKEHGNLDGLACPSCKRVDGVTANSQVPLPALVVIEDTRSIEATCRFCESKVEVDRE